MIILQDRRGQQNEKPLIKLVPADEGRDRGIIRDLLDYISIVHRRSLDDTTLELLANFISPGYFIVTVPGTTIVELTVEVIDMAGDRDRIEVSDMVPHEVMRHHYERNVATETQAIGGFVTIVQPLVWRQLNCEVEGYDRSIAYRASYDAPGFNLARMWLVDKCMIELWRIFCIDRGDPFKRPRHSGD
jgi:hypothetical protein